MAVLVGYLGFAFFSNTGQLGSSRANIQSVSQMRILATQLPGLSARAGKGDESAFVELGALKEEMGEHWSGLQDALSEGGDKSIIGGFAAVWHDAEGSITTLDETSETVLFVNNVKTRFSKNHSQLQQKLTTVVEALLTSGSTADQVVLAQAQLWRLERIRSEIDQLLAGESTAVTAAKQFDRDSKLFVSVLNGFKNGNPALEISQITAPATRTTLNDIAQLFSVVSGSATEVAASGPMLVKMGRARDALWSGSPALLEQAARLDDYVRALSSLGKLNGAQLANYAGIFLIIGVTLIGLVFYLGARSRLQKTAETNQANQDAILQLLDEIEGLGEGDLTAEVTVTEGFTGAIADAINLTIVQLRELVSRIVDTSEKVSGSANETRSTVVQLSGLSEHQAEEIAGASAAINEMAITIDQVSANAAESAAVADRSVSIANKGAVVVRRTIVGMDSIREQIQDTAKRIKRLGESSQEIGDIVSLINDIADQTNILALNAAIQASMAGDAGRGFAVVADEVQRLAERSANATKQIAALVKTIQTDTKEAVSSMEQTTAEVVSGASLTEDAGIALSEIESVSTSLAELIQDISTAARHQSTTASHISKTMNVIQDITTQALDGTNRTATSVGELADMAIEQRESVSGFKLPDQGFPQHPLKSVPFASTTKTDHSTWLDKSVSEAGTELSEPETPAGDAGAALVMEEPFADRTPAHIKQTLEENSAAMDEIDFQSTDFEPADFEPTTESTDTSDEDTAGLDAAPKAMKTPFAAELEAELASIDLDEFDLEPDSPVKNQS